MLDEATVLEWMISQKNDASIEDITREELFKYIETKEFLAVVFCMYFQLSNYKIYLKNISSPFLFRQRRGSG